MVAVTANRINVAQEIRLGTLAGKPSVPTTTPSAMKARRTAAVPLPILGRCIAASPKPSTYGFANSDDIDQLRTTVAQLAQALSAIGQVTSDHAPDHAGRAAALVMMPPGLVNRAARYLEAAAVLVHVACCPRSFSTTHAGQLADTFSKTRRACATTPASERDAPPRPGGDGGRRIRLTGAVPPGPVIDRKLRSRLAT